MATCEDVFWVYDKYKSMEFHQCKNIDCCPTAFKNKCQCPLEQPVIPRTIGGNDIPSPNYKVKCYINPGQECPICLTPIARKCNAYLTACGHAFHKNCIFKAFETKMNQAYYANYKCPICRQCLGLDIEYIDERYNSKPGSLDELENFWYKFPNICPVLCNNGINCDENEYHHLGTDNVCAKCLKYRAGEL